jgi:long-subunit fatty acid transport protein
MSKLIAGACHPRKFLRLIILALAVLALGREVVASPVGSIFSTPTSADPLSAHINPGAMTGLQGTQALLYGSLSFIRAQYQQFAPRAFDGRPYPEARLAIPKPDLALGFVTDAGLKDFRFGFGFAVPILDGAAWDEKYGGMDASTRYYAVKGRQVTFMFEPTVAYRINRYISIGIGLDVMAVWLLHDCYTDFGAKINQMACSLNANAPCELNAPLGRDDPAYASLTKVSGVGWGVGFVGGILLSPTPWFSVGLSVHSGGPVSVPVELQVDLPQTVRDYVAANLPSVNLPALTASGEVKTSAPVIFTAGVSVWPTDKLELIADMQYINKASTSLLLANVTKSSTDLIASQTLIKVLEDDWLAGLTAIYRVLPTLRVGLRVSFDNNTRPERFTTPISLDMHKLVVQAGVAWHVTRYLELTLDYTHYFIFDRSIRQTAFQPNANPTTPEEEGLDKPTAVGDYRAQTDRLAFSVVLKL